MLEYELKKIPIADIKTDGKNPNKLTSEQMGRLKKSIETYGFLVPVIVNKDMVIADGEHRLQAYKELGMKDIPVFVVDVNEVDRRTLRQIMNKLRGEHQYDMDVEEFKAILEAEGNQLKEFLEGDDKNLDKYLNKLAMEQLKDVEPDDPNQIKTDIKLGDIFTLGDHRLMCGDSTKKEDVEKLMDGQKADMVFTDPPYAVSIGKKNRDLQSIGIADRNTDNISGDDLSVDEISEQVWKPAFENIGMNLKEGGGYYVTAPQGGDQMMMMMMMMMMMKSSIPCRHELIWVKSSPTFSMGRLDYSYQHEPILYGWKGKNRCFYGVNERSVWNFDKAMKSKMHPTMKPIELCAKAINNSSRIEEVVLDLFGGSGSTLIACEQLNRKCYMCEIDPVYVQIIINRWEKLTGKKSEKVC